MSPPTESTGRGDRGGASAPRGGRSGARRPAREGPREWQQSAAVFAALGDRTRLRIVGRLSRADALSIAALTDGTGVTRQAVTKHLVVLRRAGLVQSRRRGRECLFALEAERLLVARRRLDEIAAQWRAALDRLQAFVERSD